MVNLPAAGLIVTCQKNMQIWAHLNYFAGNQDKTQ